MKSHLHMPAGSQHRTCTAKSSGPILGKPGGKPRPEGISIMLPALEPKAEPLASKKRPGEPAAKRLSEVVEFRAERAGWWARLDCPERVAACSMPLPRRRRVAVVFGEEATRGAAGVAGAADKGVSWGAASAAGTVDAEGSRPRRNQRRIRSRSGQK